MSSKKVMAAGAVAGAAAAAFVTNRIRGIDEAQFATDIDTATTLVDWERAASIAMSMNRGHALTASERERLDQYYRDLVDRCVPLVSAYVSADLPSSTAKAFGFDRVDWINANIDAFRQMLSPLELLMTSPESNGAASTLWAGVNKRIVSAELGALLGYLARRVLGQYDIALLGREPLETGNLYFVEPNISRMESTMNIPGDEFRLWLALHETTHVFQFEAFPWVRPHFNAMLDQYFAYLKEDAQYLSQSMRNFKLFADRLRQGGRDGGSWIESLMNDEQRALFLQMQSMMSVIEGHSNHVMYAVGREIMPHFDEISRKFEQRVKNRSRAEQLFAKLTGLDVKLEQYRQGQFFVDTVALQRGQDAVRAIWGNPESLPTMEEIRAPDLWIERVLD